MQKHIFFYAQAQINVFAGSCIFDAEDEDMPHRERFLAAFGGPGVSVPTDVSAARRRFPLRGNFTGR